ncbi:formyltetrahydrofolate deformylase [Streptomyces sp. NPDC091217]|uniref:formyltetrahydrofolate deformylase n=1 Tax=Streptomyces sp. NPDC091217 TaxID=3365975 RepID=UPI003828BAAD
MSVNTYVLALSCPDTAGIVHSVSSFILDHGCTIEESQQFGDRQSGRFFMRVQFRPTDEASTADIETLRGDLADTAMTLGLSWELWDTSVKPRVLIMVSKYGHCLNDLLYRAATGWLDVEVAAVVSNHEDLAWMAYSHGVAFHHVPVSPKAKPEAEARLLDLVRELDVDLVVLARYMQVLSPELCKALEGRAINIHHSMLPSFKGARPYHQAHARGVKFVGATAHYVTSDLDEGPIIEQSVTRVNHALSPGEVVALGRDNECRALARAVRWHTQRRVLLSGHRTVVFA